MGSYSTKTEDGGQSMMFDEHSACCFRIAALKPILSLTPEV